MSVIVKQAHAYDDGIYDLIDELIAGALAPYLHLYERSSPPMVVVKPNWVQEAPSSGGENWEPLITHPTVVAATVAAVAKIFGGNVRVAICDAPHTYADFAAITHLGRLPALLEDVRRRWPALRVDVLDLRRETWVFRDGVVVSRDPNPPDREGYAALNLGRDSLFYRHKGEGRYYGADYDRGEVNRHHRGETHEYLIAGTPMAADIFINLPKLKTHKKTGISCAAKNLVGINGDKNWLPHHTEGGAADGGDERPGASLLGRAELAGKKWAQAAALASPAIGRAIYRTVRRPAAALAGGSERTIRNGNWQGNDTCWRMALDLNRAFLYGNRDSTFREASDPRPYLTIVDGVIGGQGNGPLDPDCAASNVLIYADNPAEADATAATLMGFDIERLPIVREAFAQHRWPIARVALADVEVFDGRVRARIPLSRVRPAVPGGFRPHFGWGQILLAHT